MSFTTGLAFRISHGLRYSHPSCLGVTEGGKSEIPEAGLLWQRAGDCVGPNYTNYSGLEKFELQHRIFYCFCYRFHSPSQ